jgi:hypothetical protein
MSSLEGTIFALGVMGLWLLIGIRDTLKKCLTVLEKIAEK